MIAKSVRSFRRGALTPSAATAMHRIAKRDLAKNPTSMRFAVVDLDVRAGFLPSVLDAINAAQSRFSFEAVILTVRSGLTISGQRTRQIATQHKRRISKQELDVNVYAPDLIDAVEPLNRLKEYDAIGIVVARMLMDVDDEGLDWNYFSTGRGRIAVASAFELRDYAKRAGRDFEACLAFVLCGALFAQVFPKVGFHDETIGCVYDYCENRDDLVKGLTNPHLSPEALALFPEWARSDVQAVFKAIAEYRRKPE